MHYSPCPRPVSCLSLALALVVSGFCVRANAATIAFSSNADYDNNFYETIFGPDTGRTSTNGGQLEKAVENSATIAIYNTTATGGSGGSGGTGAATLNNNTFVNFTMQMDFSTPLAGANGNSLGLFAKINSTATTGYVGIFRIIDANTVDFRLFDSDSNPTGGGLSTTIQSGNITSTGSFAINTPYNFRLNVLDVGSNVQFTASVFTTGGVQLGSSVVLTDTTAAVVGAGQVGLRMGSNAPTATVYDNFTVTPEPSALVLSLFSGTGLLMIRRRRR